MTDKQLKEDAGLYALGMLKGADRSRFERRLEELPELRSFVAEMEDGVAAVALTAPAEEADPANLEAILEKVASRRALSLLKAPAFLLRVPGGWPVAAALALLLGSGATRYQTIKNKLNRVEGERDAIERQVGEEMRQIVVMLDNGAEVANAADPKDLDNGNSATISSITGLKHLQAAKQKSYQLVQKLEQVKGQLAKLQTLNSDRATPNGNVARPLSVTMWNPDVPPEEREIQSLLPEDTNWSESVSNAIADEFETAGQSGQQPEEPEELGNGAGDDPGEEPEFESVPVKASFEQYDEFVVKGGALTPPWVAGNLPNGVPIRHENFPVESWQDLGLERYQADSFYDPVSHMIYSPGFNGSDYFGTPAPPDFDPSSTEPPAVPEPEAAPVPQPVATTEPVPLETAISEPEPNPEPEPVVPSPMGLTVYDESTGKGLISLLNLPAPSEGMSYHLWVDDPRLDGPIDIGILPEMDFQGGRVEFELDPGLSPAGYILTAEPRGESPELPGDSVILYGP